MFVKPARLKAGDKVAAITDSWGGAGALPHRFQAGVNQIKAEFDLEVVPMTHTLRSPAWISAHPKARATDLMEAFRNPEIKGIFSVIGGEDSIRLLPYVDLDVIRTNPKVFIGFSDTTVSHYMLLAAGVVTFYGASILAGFAENTGMFPYLSRSVRANLFSSEPVGQIYPNPDGWTVEFLDWSVPEHQNQRRVCQPAMPWRWVQGSGRVQGRLMGGCLEVLDWLRGTPVWPSRDVWSGSVLVLETSEEQPTPTAVARMLRTLAAAGAFTDCAGLLMGRPCTDDLAAMDAQDAAVLAFVQQELGRDDLPVVTRMDFGHTSPVFTIPLGVMASLDCDGQVFRIDESGTC